MNNTVFLSDRKNGLRPGVVACIINKEQKILFCFSSKHQIWEMPQVEIRESEDLKDALKRGVEEELGQEFTQSLFVPPNPLIVTNQIIFPRETIEGKMLLVEGEEVPMIGKKYYFCLVAQTVGDIEPEKIEYSDFKWLSFEEGLKIIQSIPQRGKKRILGEAFEVLKRSELIK